jgi:hypothetical protein
MILICPGKTIYPGVSRRITLREPGTSDAGSDTSGAPLQAAANRISYPGTISALLGTGRSRLNRLFSLRNGDSKYR